MTTVPHNNKKNIIIGCIIIIFGILLLLKNILPAFPSFIFSFSTILIMIGIIIGIRTNFKNILSYAFICVGALHFVHRNIIEIPIYKALFLPLALIFFGIYILTKSKSQNISPTNYSPYPQQNTTESSPGLTYEYGPQHQEQTQQDNTYQQQYQEDIIHSNAYLGNQKNVVYSKTLKYADVNCMLGNVDLNLRLADFDKEVVIDLLVICGNVEIKMPSNWYIINETVSILGGLKDKRNLFNIHPDTSKRVILRGTCLMGAIELKN